MGGPAGILNLNEAKSGVRVSLHRSFGSLRQMRDRLITLCGGCHAVRHGHQITSAPRTIVEFLSTLSAQSADSFNCGGRNTHLPPPWTARSLPEPISSPRLNPICGSALSPIESVRGVR